MPRNDIVSTPMLELLSVGLHLSEGALGFGRELLIYGRIWATTALGDMFVLYDRALDDPELVQPGLSLSLSGPKPMVVLHSTPLTVNVELLDKLHNTVVAGGSFSIDHCNNSFDKEQGVERVNGQEGAYVLLKYATIPFAVTSTVEVLYFTKDHVAKPPKFPESADDSDLPDYSDYDSDGDGRIDDIVVAHVSGSVFAKSKYMFQDTTEKSDTHFRISLLHKHPREPLKVISGTPLELDRCTLPVPAYSPLKIYINLMDGDSRVISSSVVFKPQDDLIFKKDILGDNGRVRVRVEWNHGYSLLNIYESVSRGLSTLTIYESVPRGLADYSELPYPFAEVFSVVVFSKRGPSFYVHRKIHVHDADPFPIFDKNHRNPQLCSQFEVLESVVGPSHALCTLDGFAISSYLTDEDGNNISSGCMSLNSSRLENSNLYDNRVCSVLRGKYGFAAIHYSVFRNGIQCRVKVVLYETSPTGPCVLVSGKLMAQYGCSSYQTSYEQKYCRSTLFQGFETLQRVGYGLPETWVSNLPLLKEIVSAPRRSSLAIEVDLTAIDVDDPLVVGVLKGTLVFRESDSGREQELSMGNYRLSVSVLWVHSFA